ncbi:hypothetical protein GCM10018954_080090 [Kutzneria kofuensis]
MALQASLFDQAEAPALGPLTGVRRTQLTEGAWIDVLPGWLTGADLLFERLVGHVPWYAERRQMYDRIVDVPRLVCFYREHVPLPDPVLTARDALTDHYGPELGEPFRTAGMCYYRDGQDSVAWHGDNTGRKVDRTMVAIVSLGAPRARSCSAPRAAARASGTCSATAT